MVYLLLPLLLFHPVSMGLQQGPSYSISIPAVKMAADESVVSFEIDVTAGAFEAVSNLPPGWHFDVDNDASWQTKIIANAMVGAASLPPDQFKSLRFVVRKNEFGDLKFHVSGMVSVTKDYQNERQVTLTMRDFSMSLVR